MTRRGWFKKEWHGVAPGTLLEVGELNRNFLGSAWVREVERVDGLDLPGPFGPGPKAFVDPEFITILEDAP